MLRCCRIQIPVRSKLLRVCVCVFFVFGRALTTDTSKLDPTRQSPTPTDRASAIIPVPQLRDIHEDHAGPSMSQRLLERYDGQKDTMADEPELSPPGDQSSSDEETVKGDEGGHVTDILEEERLAAGTPVLTMGNGSLAHRYRDIVKAEAAADTSSETGSVDAIPRRAGSPIDSLLSVPDDSPSIQVRSLPPITLARRALNLF